MPNVSFISARLRSVLCKLILYYNALRFPRAVCQPVFVFRGAVSGLVGGDDRGIHGSDEGTLGRFRQCPSRGGAIAKVSVRPPTPLR